ncbi:hypothetical protein [Oligoflexus tunisiensis]|uniref:hypothetical protein n=1 Tax=Oligoflexus tunisiensis TaxID=708132 RepID=UPI00114CE913|nr:hypothetical protein [Oligoflexus tunisiensis]
MKKLLPRSSLLLAVIALPTQVKDKWELETYSRIPVNDVSFAPEGIRIKVRKSASPLMYPLAPQPGKISSFKISGTFQGLPEFADVRRQGEKGADDYALRLGLIVPGSRQLSGWQKLLAPAWVKNLYQKMPQGMGLDAVHFFNITQNPAQVNSVRVHPASELIREEFIAHVSQPGPFQYEYKLKEPASAVALWLAVDGDDTQSNYDVVISSLELRSEP